MLKNALAIISLDNQFHTIIKKYTRSVNGSLVVFQYPIYTFAG